MGMGMGTKIVGMGCGWGHILRGRGGDGDTAGGDGAEMGLTQWGRGGDGDRDNGDGWGWGQILVPMQLSTVKYREYRRESKLFARWQQRCDRLLSAVH